MRVFYAFSKSMSSDRRQFERLAIPDEALAIDETGRKLGLVSHAGGGGMTITLGTEAPSFEPGSRLRVVVEEASGIRHTIPVEVKYCQNGDLGVEFVSPI